MAGINVINPSGYSGTPLAKKLGIKEHFTIALFNQPEYYFKLFNDWPASLNLVRDIVVRKNLIHYFARNAGELTAEIVSLREQLVPDGILWVSWPKQSSKVPTDVTEDMIRKLALANGLVDIKVCAVDEVWSALKLVIPVKKQAAISTIMYL